MKKTKIMSIFGTRPEAIKMAPVVEHLKNDPDIESVVCVTAQHREMLDQVLALFDITPDYDLNIMKANQTLSEITARVLTGLDEVIKTAEPDMILVHGDTTTTLSAALAAFYNGVKIGHVEAGLRSHDKHSPYPEEINRSLTGKLADLHFSPTEGNRDNLLREGVNENTIVMTGNTVIDALLEVVREDYVFNHPVLDSLDYKNNKIILLTAHRRENLGEPMENIFGAVRQIIDENPETILIFPIHLNPKVREIAKRHLEGSDRIHMIEPLDYEPFANLIGRSYLVLTDSGGIQEEAPALGKPVLVLRTETERPEAVASGTVKMAGVVRERIVELSNELVRNPEEYAKMANAVNPYGDGQASERIVQAIKNYYKI